MDEAMGQRLLAYTHDELSADERAELEALLATDARLRRHVEQLRQEEALMNTAMSIHSIGADRRQIIRQVAAGRILHKTPPAPAASRARLGLWLGAGLAAAAAVVLVVWAVRALPELNKPRHIKVGAPTVAPPVKDDPKERKPQPQPPIKTVRVEPGRFTMGSGQREKGRQSDEGQVPVVLTEALEVGVTEVTQGQWVELMGTGLVEVWTATEDPMPIGGKRHTWDPQRPVTHVNWYSAIHFANAVSKAHGLEQCYDLSDCEGMVELGQMTCKAIDSHAPCEGWRLPFEAEWEYFAKANGKPSVDGWTGMKKVERVQPVASLTPNGFGLYDTIGNALEWTLDVYEADYLGGKNPVSRGPGSRPKVLRGGGWRSHGERFDEHQWRVARRFKAKADHRSNVVGFRLVRNAPKEAPAKGDGDAPK